MHLLLTYKSIGKYIVVKVVYIGRRLYVCIVYSNTHAYAMHKYISYINTVHPALKSTMKSSSWLHLYELAWYNISWWRHQMEPFSALLALCAGNSPVPANSPHNGQWRGALMFPLIRAGINYWVNNPEAGDLTLHRSHYDVTLMLCCCFRATVRIILHSNTAINILIYSMRLRDFREAIKTNIRNCFRGGGCLSISTRMW